MKKGKKYKVDNAGLKGTKKVVKKDDGDNYPLFCFKYLSDCSIKDCKNYNFFLEFLLRLQKLSALGWKEIRRSHRHKYGMEKVPLNQIHPKKLPVCITPEMKYLHVFRADGKKHPFLGRQDGKIFRVLFIETKFGDIYDHKKKK